MKDRYTLIEQSPCDGSCVGWKAGDTPEKEIQLDCEHNLRKIGEKTKE